MQNITDYKQRFKEDGFVILEKFIPENLIDRLFQQINEILDYTLGLKNVDVTRFKNVNEKYLYLRDNFPGIKKNVYNLIKQLDSLHFIVNQQKLTDVVKDITGSFLFIDSPQVRIDDASNDFMLPLHQEAFGCISYNAITAWIPMINIDAQTGGIRFVKASHKNGFMKHGFKNNYHALDDSITQSISKEEIPDFNKGDVLLFDSKLFHGSSPMRNKNDIRWTVVSRFSPKFNVPSLEDENQPLRTEKLDTSR